MNDTQQTTLDEFISVVHNTLRNDIMTKELFGEASPNETAIRYMIDSYNGIATRYSLPKIQSATKATKDRLRRIIWNNDGANKWSIALKEIAYSTFIQERIKSDKEKKRSCLHYILDPIGFDSLVSGAYRTTNATIEFHGEQTNTPYEGYVSVPNMQIVPERFGTTESGEPYFTLMASDHNAGELLSRLAKSIIMSRLAADEFPTDVYDEAKELEDFAVTMKDWAQRHRNLLEKKNANR